MPTYERVRVAAPPAAVVDMASLLHGATAPLAGEFTGVLRTLAQGVGDRLAG